MKSNNPKKIVTKLIERLYSDLTIKEINIFETNSYCVEKNEFIRDGYYLTILLNKSSEKTFSTSRIEADIENYLGITSGVEII
jgi:hypothetical protein